MGLVSDMYLVRPRRVCVAESEKRDDKLEAGEKKSEEVLGVGVNPEHPSARR